MTKQKTRDENFSADAAALIASIQPKPRRPPNPQCTWFLPSSPRHTAPGRETYRRRCLAFALDGETLCVNHSPSLCAQLIRAERVEASLLSRGRARLELVPTSAR